MDRSRIPKFYQANYPERLEILRERGVLNKQDFYSEVTQFLLKNFIKNI